MAGALYYSRPGGTRTGAVLAIGFLVATALAFLLLPRRRRTLLGFLVAFVVVLVWWLQVPASNDHDWQPKVAVAPWASRNGDRITIHGVRNFDYRSETDFTPRWEDRTYDLRTLDSGDLIAVYWAGKAIAHIMVSFGSGGATTSPCPSRRARRVARAIPRSRASSSNTDSSTSSPTNGT